MSATLIYSGYLPSDNVVVSDFLGQATALYLATPFSPYEIEIDIWLQLYTDNGTRRIRLTDDVVTIDTETVIFIPYEYQNLSINKRVAVYSSGNDYIELYALFGDVPDNNIQLVLDAINQLKEDITVSIDNESVQVEDLILPLTNLILGL